MNVVCVPIKSYKSEEFGEITLLYNSVMYYNTVTLPMHLCFLSWITGAGIYLESTWSFLLAFEQRFLFKDMCVVFPPERKQIQFYPLRVTSPVIHGFIDLILNTWPILLIINFYVEQT